MRTTLHCAGERPGSARVRKTWVCPAPPPSGRTAAERRAPPAVAKAMASVSWLGSHPPTAVWGQAVSHLSLVGPTRQLQ